MPDSPDTTDQPDKDDLASLREAAKKGSVALTENEQLKREMAFMRAGIPTDTKPAQALISSYDGELTAEAIQAEAKEWGLVQTEKSEQPAKQFDETSPERQSQALRDQVQGNVAPTPDPPQKNAVDTALDNFHKNRAAGMNQTEAVNHVFGEVIKGAAMGDPVARFDQDAWEKERAKHGHGAEFAR